MRGGGEKGGGVMLCGRASTLRYTGRMWALILSCRAKEEGGETSLTDGSNSME